MDAVNVFLCVGFPSSYLLFANNDIGKVNCFPEQDWRIAERIEREGKGCLIVVNKWDTIPNKNQETATRYEQDVREKLRNLVWAPIVYATAIAGHSVEKYAYIRHDLFCASLTVPLHYFLEPVILFQFLPCLTYDMVEKLPHRNYEM